MSQSPQVIARINELRSMSLQRELTMEEMQEAVRLIRGDRKGAQVASTASRAKKAAAKAPIDVQNVLDNLF